MDQHALAILVIADSWNLSNTKRIQGSGTQGGKFERIMSKLLYYLILESQKFGSGVLNQFWNQLGACHEKLKENIESLKEQQFVSTRTSRDVLFRGLEPENIDFSPILNMTAEFFTHLGVAFMNQGGRKSAGGSAFSVSEIVDEETEKLLETVDAEGDFGKRKQGALKTLSFRRDGVFCLLTTKGFMPHDEKGIPPALAHIIPNSVHGKPDTLKCIAMFAGAAAADDVVQHLNKIGNVMNMEQNAHTAYDNLMWGIEAKEESGKIRYFFRAIPTVAGQQGPGFIALREGDEIRFGRGVEGNELNIGPIPRLCNLQLAVARALKMSGAADIILEWQDQADDDGLFRLFIASEEFCDMVDAKLLLSGRAMIA